MSCIEKLRILININVVFKHFNMNQLTKEMVGVARETERGGPTRLVAQLAERWGPII
jgi:hypothetical protein